MTSPLITLITGAHGNMGRALCSRFSEGAHHVIAVDAHPSASPIAAAEAHALDLGDAEASETFVQSVVASHARIDVAVLTVGGFAMGSIAETSTADIAQQYKLNFETAYNIARPVFLQMLKQSQGRLFLVGARPALSAAGSKGMVAYGLAKSLIFRVAELMNDEAKGSNVSVHVVVPSIIDTPQNRAAMPDANFSSWVSSDTIADVIAFYASERARALRETVIKVYGDS